jgi:hypothetical protein
MAQTKQQKEMVALVVLIVIAAIVWYGFVGKSRIGAAGLFQPGTAAQYVPLEAEDYAKPILQLEKTRSTEYKASGRNIFVAHAVPTAPEHTSGAAPTKPQDTWRIYDQPRPLPPPPPPQLGMKFFGYGSTPVNSPRRAFLQDGDVIQIVGEGDIIKSHIRITHIGNDSIEYEDTNTGMKNKEPLETPPATPTQ